MREAIGSLPFQFEVQSHAKWEFEMTLHLGAEGVGGLMEKLAPLQEGLEVWVRLPPLEVQGAVHQWVLLWKLRQGESRLLLAHPDPLEWVATIALSDSDYQAFVDRLKQRQAFDFKDLFSVRAPSNFHLRVRYGHTYGT